MQLLGQDLSACWWESKEQKALHYFESLLISNRHLKREKMSSFAILKN
jgi:hypothetical protein